MSADGAGLGAQVTVSLAAKPSTGRPASPSNFMLVDRGEWWNLTVEGFENGWQPG